MVQISILYIGRLKKNFSAFFEVGRGTGYELRVAGGLPAHS